MLRHRAETAAPGSQGSADSLPDLSPGESEAPEQASEGHAQAWETLALTVARYVLTAANVPGGTEMVSAASDLFKAFSHAQEAQSSMLQQLNSEVEMLRMAPYHSALLLLSEAERVGPADEHYGKFLDDASLQLYEAHPLCESVEEEAVVDFHLGVVYTLLDRPSDAAYWMLESCKSGHKILDDLASRASDVKVVKHKSLAALATLSSVVTFPVTVPAGVAMLVKKHNKTIAARAATGSIEELVPFVNSAISCYNSLQSDHKMPAIVLKQGRHHHLEIHQGGEDGGS